MNNMKSRVSSTINKDIKNFGKQFMFDGKDETCWNSDEGDNQWIWISFENPITFSSIEIQFQGGFAAETGLLQIFNDSQNIDFVEKISFENNNLMQCVRLSEDYKAQNVRVQFNKFFDTFGRIIVYHFRLK